jgi:hypothetical protein
VINKFSRKEDENSLDETTIMRRQASRGELLFSPRGETQESFVGDYLNN